VLGECRVRATHLADEREHHVGHRVVGIVGMLVVDERPAQLVAANWGRGVLHRLAQQVGGLQCAGLLVVEALDEQQIRDLLDYFQRVGHPPGPHRVPDPVDLVSDFGSEHAKGTPFVVAEFNGTVSVKPFADYVAVGSFGSESPGMYGGKPGVDHPTG
jgi:hypothetical protein